MGAGRRVRCQENRAKNLLVQGLTLKFRLATGWLKAVDGNLSLTLRELEANELFTAVRDWGMLPIYND